MFGNRGRRGLEVGREGFFRYVYLGRLEVVGGGRVGFGLLVFFILVDESVDRF